MIIIGLLRGVGGIVLFMNGNQLQIDAPIIATNFEINLIAVGLLLICVLLIIAAINLIITYSRKSWIYCWIVLILFLLDGLLNGYLLFGHPLDQGQRINFIAATVSGVLLLLGKPISKNV